jgi:hypothetical protein
MHVTNYCSSFFAPILVQKGFILAQLLGAVAATLLFRRLAPALPERAPAVIIAHDEAAFLSASEGKADGPLAERVDFRFTERKDLR